MPGFSHWRQHAHNPVLGNGVESTAILVRWLLEPETRPCALDELLVLTAQTGDEYEDTGVLCERYILPLLRAERIRFVEVARRGHLEKEGIVVLANSRSPGRMHMDGAYKLSDELRSAGTSTSGLAQEVTKEAFRIYRLLIRRPC